MKDKKDYEACYNAAFRIAESRYSTEEDESVRECLELMFPGLKESEGERIRRSLIDFFSRGAENNELTNGISDKAILAWLKRIEGENGDLGDGDRRLINDVIELIDAGSLDREEKDDYIERLKSLEQKFLWQPTDVQMDILMNAYLSYYHGDEGAKALSPILKSLHDDLEWLKSLRLQPNPSDNEWRQENNSELTEFECAMLHVGESFFGGKAGLDPNNTSVVKKQAELLLGLVKGKDECAEEESVTDLEEEIRRYVDAHDNQGSPELREKLSECALHFADWQRKLDADLGNPSYERGYHDGREFERSIR